MQQMREAFPWDHAPRYVLRDRDAIYGRDFADTIRDMGMEEVPTAPRSPWQNPFAERVQVLSLWANHGLRSGSRPARSATQQHARLYGNHHESPKVRSAFLSTRDGGTQTIFIGG